MLIKIRAYPNAGKQEIIRKKQDEFEIWVKEKPIQGQGNRAIIRILADYFKTNPQNIRLIKGFRERNKIFEIKNGL